MRRGSLLRDHRFNAAASMRPDLREFLGIAGLRHHQFEIVRIKPDMHILDSSV